MVYGDEKVLSPDKELEKIMREEELAKERKKREQEEREKEDKLRKEDEQCRKYVTREIRKACRGCGSLPYGIVPVDDTDDSMDM